VELVRAIRVLATTLFGRAPGRAGAGRVAPADCHIPCALHVLELSDNFKDMDVEKVTRKIRERIAGGEWAAGEQIDTFDTLMERYSLPTVYRVRQVLRPLIEEGLIESRHGSGTYVLRRPAPDPEPTPDPVQAARDILDQVATEMADLRRRIDAARGLLAGVD
jgi:DNA-binding GntR family transcriptional regulator